VLLAVAVCEQERNGPAHERNGKGTPLPTSRFQVKHGSQQRRRSARGAPPIELDRVGLAALGTETRAGTETA
jgi:hypothetical protein